MAQGAYSDVSIMRIKICFVFLKRGLNRERKSVRERERNL